MTTEQEPFEIKLVLIGIAPDDNFFRIKARRAGGYVITNHITKRKEVYAMSEKADEVKRILFPVCTLHEKDGKYYFLSNQSMIEITRIEFEQLTTKLKQS